MERGKAREIERGEAGIRRREGKREDSVARYPAGKAFSENSEAERGTERRREEIIAMSTV